MSHPILPLAIALGVVMPHVDLNPTSKDPISCMKNNQSIILIARSRAGDDPHGNDPHDEVHDDDLPANDKRDMPAVKDDGDYKAPKDQYGGTHYPYGAGVPNGDKPY